MALIQRITRAFLPALLFLIALATQALSAGMVQFSTFSSATNKLIASHLLLTHRESGSSLKLSRNELAAPLHLPSGTWDVSAHAHGHHPIQTSIRADGTEPVTMEIFLDPLSTPVPLRPETIDRLRKSDATLVVGFVVDRQTGLPLDGVRVSNGKTSTTTDASGYYSIYLPVNADWENNILEFTKNGYAAEQRNGLETWGFGDWIANVRMQSGNELRTVNESKTARGASQQINDCTTCDAQNSTNNPLSTVIPIPASIRVGRTCTGTSCTTVEVYTVQTYCKYVLPAEWYSCWGSLANGMNSLQAGSVAIRSYGLWYVYNPLRSNYDICDNTSCQAFGSVQSTNANNAVDATDRYILLTTSNAVARSEYSAENNNKGCGDGYTGTGTSWPCILDLPCQTTTPNGHGRGMCQWGSVRWANGTRVLTSSPCTQGASHGQGTKTWQQILSHYYPTYTLVQGVTATLNSATPSPSSVAQGSTFNIQYSLTTTGALPLMLGASIAPAGTSTLTSDPARDIKVSLFDGANVVQRSFLVPTSQPTGAHDLYVSLWHDKNNSNTIDSGDLLMSSAQYNNSLTITILPVQLASFTATAANNRDIELRWRTLSEINNLGFYVQRKRHDEQDWIELAFVAGHGTTSVPHDYLYVDLNVGSGRWLYRLRQVDLDGTVHFTDPVEATIVTGVAMNTPTQFKLYQNHPNPFNPATTIRFTIGGVEGPLSSHVKLTVYDLLGREVAILLNEPLDAGMHTVTWDAAGLASGVYTYVLTSGGERAAKRLVLMR